ncbi:hypothetical protein OROMI_014709 [Orobanche minor]
MLSDQAPVRLDESARFSMTMQAIENFLDSTLCRLRTTIDHLDPLFQSTPPSQSGSCFCSCLLLLFAAFCCKLNARGRAVYSPVNADKKASVTCYENYI